MAVTSTGLLASWSRLRRLHSKFTIVENALANLQEVDTHRTKVSRRLEHVRARYLRIATGGKVLVGQNYDNRLIYCCFRRIRVIKRSSWTARARLVPTRPLTARSNVYYDADDAPNLVEISYRTYRRNETFFATIFKHLLL